MKEKLPAIVLLFLLTLGRVEAQEPTAGKPRQIAVNVLGEVNQPGRYFLPEGATVLNAFAVAGGFGQSADLKNVRSIHATTGDKPLAARIDMKAVLAGTMVAPILHEGDSLHVQRKVAGAISF